MSGVRDAVVVAAILTAGLVAGLFAAFAYSVMPGLDRATPSAAIEVMQRINAAILNPVFGLVFGGGLVLAALAAVLAWGGSLRWWALAAFGCYVAGVLITMLFNVPLNVRLDAVGDASGTQAAAAWADFSGAWVRWNLARAGIHLLGFALLTAGLVTR
ncbi:anthrone oxygenase family protein [Gordonia crocea]|uniref:Membrane protein n=1 Tax=Gordonia crocea TaxID=589162 RepID=A0A7I9UV31_9ACTN|nr:anthrone oxygenase family protein [Gordonia crocea]GED96792.1 membrane protein [Gordonia crocea]